jgi:3-isopropylmalate dehydratase small subunit
MKAFSSVTSRAIGLPAAGIDTDIIYPARFLLITDKAGLGRYAFYEWRHDADGKPRSDTPLNDPAFANAAIMVAGDNFGCGSSREQAPWAMDGMGIRAVISTSFGEIFYNNCFRNGMLPVIVEAADHALLMADALAGRVLCVDLETRRIRREDGSIIAFPVEDWRRDALLNGWDEVAMIRSRHREDIARFEDRQRTTQPWLWADS